MSKCGHAGCATEQTCASPGSLGRCSPARCRARVPLPRRDRCRRTPKHARSPPQLRAQPVSERQRLRPASSSRSLLATRRAYALDRVAVARGGSDLRYRQRLFGADAAALPDWFATYATRRAGWRTTRDSGNGPYEPYAVCSHRAETQAALLECAQPLLEPGDFALARTAWEQADTLLHPHWLALEPVMLQWQRELPGHGRLRRAARDWRGPRPVSRARAPGRAARAGTSSAGARLRRARHLGELLQLLDSAWPRERWRLADVMSRVVVFSEDRESEALLRAGLRAKSMYLYSPVPQELGLPESLSPLLHASSWQRCALCKRGQTYSACCTSSLRAPAPRYPPAARALGR
jgi:hypothetical protein